MIGAVVVIAVATVVVLAGLVTWGGGGAASATVTGAGSPVGSGLGQGAGSGAASSDAVPRVGTYGAVPGGNAPAAGGSSGGTSPADSGSSRPGAALDSSALAPPGGVEVPPSDPSVNREWRVVGQTWQAVMARYRTAFPVPGFQLDRQIGAWGDPGNPHGQGWSITSADGSDAGHLAVHDDGDGTAVLVDYEEPS